MQLADWQSAHNLPESRPPAFNPAFQRDGPGVVRDRLTLGLLTKAGFSPPRYD
jgi:hypothetical protein